MPEIACEWCEKTIYRKPSRLKKYKHQFCSKKCHDAWQTDYARKNGLSQLITCEQCGKQFYRSISNTKQTKRHYCSQECCNAWRTGRPRPEHGEKMRRILKGRRPSPQCLASVSRANTRRLKNPETQAMMQTALKEKRQDLEWAEAYGQRVSNGLKQYYETHDGPNLGRTDLPRGPDHPFWKGGVGRVGRGASWEEQSEKARKRDDYVCQECGMTQTESIEKWGRRLSVHHIVPFSEFDSWKEANQLSNLITLCASCHRSIECQLIFNGHNVDIEQPV